jgi:hypothetical protein
MIKISHRGNITGSNVEKENRPSYIDVALQLGYNVEIDIRFINNEFWLGHDFPQYKVDLNWLSLRKDKLWIHCKDKNSASEFLKCNQGFNFFCHTMDHYVLTSSGHIWLHDLSSNVDETTIIPLLNLEDIENYIGSVPFAICSDYVSLL